MTFARLYGILQGALGTRNSSMLSAGSARKQATGGRSHKTCLCRQVCSHAHSGRADRKLLKAGSHGVGDGDRARGRPQLHQVQRTRIQVLASLRPGVHPARSRDAGSSG